MEHQGFTIYESRKVYSTEPVAYFTKSAFVLNRMVADKCCLSDCKHVHLGYNPKTEQMAMFLLKQPDEMSIALQRRPSGMVQVSSSGFLERFGLHGRIHEKMQVTPPDRDGDPVIFTFTGKKRIHGHIKKSPKPAAPIPVPSAKPAKKPLVDYACTMCSYSSPAWKHNQSMKPLGHPEKCPKCGSYSFTEE